MFLPNFENDSGAYKFPKKWIYSKGFPGHCDKPFQIFEQIECFSDKPAKTYSPKMQESLGTKFSNRKTFPSEHISPKRESSVGNRVETFTSKIKKFNTIYGIRIWNYWFFNQKFFTRVFSPLSGNDVWQTWRKFFANFRNK